MKLKTVKVNGHRCDIDVNSDGRFSARVAGQFVHAMTLEELRKLLKKASQRPKITVAVPISILGRNFHKPQYGRQGWVSGWGVQQVTLVSLGVDGDVRYRDDLTGETGALYDIRGTRVRRLTNDEIAEYTRLYKAKQAASQALHAFEERVALPEQPHELVRAAVAAQEDTPQEPPEESADPRLSKTS